MADGALSRARERSRPISSHWSAVLRVAAIYVASRALTTGFLVLVTHISGPRSRFGAGPTLGDIVVGWDATWYWLVAVDGYPAELPMTEAGVGENQWAFMPVFAYVAAALGALLGSWGAGAVVVSLVAGFAASLALYALTRSRLDESAALWAVAFFASGPLAALFQVGYAESLFLAFLLAALLCLQQRRYAWLYLLIPLMGYTRPGVLAFALLLGLFGIWRWFRRSEEPLGAVEVGHILVLGSLATVVGFSWQIIAGVVTGDPGAYLDTELAWRRNWIGTGEAGFIPFEGFVQASAFWFRTWGWGEVAGYIAFGALVVGLALVLLRERHVRRLGVEVRLWSASYLLYLLAVFFPQSSVFRLLVPLSPLWGALAAPRSTLWRCGVLLAAIAGQWWWIYNMYALGNTYWQIP